MYLTDTYLDVDKTYCLQEMIRDKYIFAQGFMVQVNIEVTKLL